MAIRGRAGATDAPGKPHDDAAPAGSPPTWAAPGGRPVAQGAACVLWAVDLPDDGPTGGFYRDGRPVP
jgi:hypothetical protein